MGDGEEGEGESDCRDQGDEGVPAPPRREPIEKEEGRVEEEEEPGRWAPDPPP